jgi:hypothetical protein
MVTRILFWGALSILVGCAPELDDRISRVTSPRVIALTSFPAEAAPTEMVTLRGLHVGPQGELPWDGSSWAFCTERKPLTELGPISPACLVAEGESLGQLGQGAAATGAIPADACRLFGPDRPEPKAGEPAGRPVDPDFTGGYHQPVRVLINGSFVSGGVRVTCGLSGATPAQAATFREQYGRNEAPAPDALLLKRGENAAEPLGDDAAPIPSVAPNERVTLEVSWPLCSKEANCGGAETYLWFDPDERTLKERREGIRVSWFVTAGTLDADRTGRAEDEADSNSSQNGWTAPADVGIVYLWIVVRDDRGGVGWRAGKIQVGQP